MMNYFYNTMDGAGYGFGVFGFIFMIAFWVLIIWGVISLVRCAGGHCGHDGARAEKNALNILKERYAKGEIGKEEFEEKKKDLE